MPEIKNYDGKKKKPTTTHPKRRPHHEIEQENEEEVMEAEFNTEAQNEGVTEPELEVIEESRATAEGMPEPDPEIMPDLDPAKEHLEFYGSDVIREKAPKVMALAETVLEEWKKDGQFEGLPVGNPIAQMAAAKALRKAKDVEKKLEEKGVFVMAKMGLDFVKAKIDKRNH